MRPAVLVHEVQVNLLLQGAGPPTRGTQLFLKCIHFAVHIGIDVTRTGRRPPVGRA